MVKMKRTLPPQNPSELVNYFQRKSATTLNHDLRRLTPSAMTLK